VKKGVRGEIMYQPHCHLSQMQIMNYKCSMREKATTEKMPRPIGGGRPP